VPAPAAWQVRHRLRLFCLSVAPMLRVCVSARSADQLCLSFHFALVFTLSSLSAASLQNAAVCAAVPAAPCLSALLMRTAATMCLACSKGERLTRSAKLHCSRRLCCVCMLGDDNCAAACPPHMCLTASALACPPPRAASVPGGQPVAACWAQLPQRQPTGAAMCSPRP
jgi:hypothetical protein